MMTTKPRALLSVSDKTGIGAFGAALVERGWELLSTGGTGRALREAGLPVIDVADVTGHPEMMDGRVKTLHPAVHAGLLARRERNEDLQALREHGYAPIDLVVVNLYPFRETVAKSGVTVDEAKEKVDIGGPTMLRAAAKNYASVWVVVDPADYARVLEAMDATADETALRLELAAKVFAHTSAYDSAIAAYLRGVGTADGEPEPSPETRKLPTSLALELERIQELRYGENPDQAASFYRWAGSGSPGLVGLAQLHGKELSYNNLLDLDGALLALSPFAYSDRAAVCIVKHTTPCGLAVADELELAYRAALRTDSTSAFGSVVAVNRPVDGPTAAALAQLFVECIVAPGFSDEALTTLMAKKNLRLLTFPPDVPEGDPPPVAAEAWWERAGPGQRATTRFLAQHGRVPWPRVVRSVYGGLLAQTPPAPPFYGIDDANWRVVTKRGPTEAERDDLQFAWAAVFGVKSNAILLAKDGATCGIGAGQMSRVDASRLAVIKAGDAGIDLAGAALASDAFFPFRDGVDAAAEAGVTCIVQPGGSIRDEEVIEAANEHGIAMVFTGRRLFRH